MIISVDGNIGSGKSTFIEKLASELTEKSDQIAVYPEDVDNWSKEGWLQLFYSDMSKYGFGFQSRVLMSYGQLFKSSNYPQKVTTIVERNKKSSMMIFSKNSLNNGRITQLEYDTLMKLADMLINWTPNIIIYVNTPPAICQKRINQRKRNGEAGIPLEYLQQIHELHTAYLDYMKSIGVRVEEIDGTQSAEKVYQDGLAIICKNTTHPELCGAKGGRRNTHKNKYVKRRSYRRANIMM